MAFRWLVQKLARQREEASRSAERAFRTSRYESFEDRLAFSADPVLQLPLEPLNRDILPQATLNTAPQNASTIDYGLDYVRQTYGFLGAGQTVAVIDSGIAYDHPALGGGLGANYRVVGGWDFAENDANPYDDAPAGFHGTHVAGILASSDATYRGVAPGADLVGLRVFNDQGATEVAWVEAALRWVHEHRNTFENPITVVNLSIGFEWNGAGLPPSAQFEDELSQLHRDGIFVAVSAGNSYAKYNSPGVGYPAASPYVTPVASVGADGNLSSFSQRNARVIAAPGERITSTVPDYAHDLNGRTDDFERSTGTSMAAPFVAGAAVLVREAMVSGGRTNITADDLYNHLYNTADLVFDAATNATYHRINVGRAVDAALPADDDGSTVNDAAPVNWGAVRFNTFADQALAGPEAWRTVRATRDGILTVEAFFAHAQGNVNLEAYDAQGALVASSRSRRNGERIDVAVDAGQTLTIKIIGANAAVDFRLTNLVSASEGVIDVAGTNGADQFSFAAGASHVIEVNGVQYTFPASDFPTVRFHGGRGADAIVLTGTTANERLTARPGDITFTGRGWTVTTDGIETLDALGGGGRDTAVLYDSRGNDHYFGSPNQSRLTSEGFDHRIAGFATVEVRAGHRYDVATLMDSAGDDVFTAKTREASLTGAGYRQTLFGFTNVRAIATSGYDVALLYDGAGADRFVAQPGMASMKSAIAASFAAGFDEVHAYATGGGHNTAWLFDSAADDRLSAALGEVVLTGPGFQHAATGFGVVQAAATAGGLDRAEFFRISRDEFTQTSSEGKQRGGGYLNIASSFERVTTTNAEIRQNAFSDWDEIQPVDLRTQAIAAAHDEELCAAGQVFQDLGA